MFLQIAYIKYQRCTSTPLRRRRTLKTYDANSRSSGHGERRKSKIHAAVRTASTGDFPLRSEVFRFRLDAVLLFRKLRLFSFVLSITIIKKKTVCSAAQIAHRMWRKYQNSATLNPRTYTYYVYIYIYIYIYTPSLQ